MNAQLMSAIEKPDFPLQNMTNYKNNFTIREFMLSSNISGNDAAYAQIITTFKDIQILIDLEETNLIH